MWNMRLWRELKLSVWVESCWKGRKTIRLQVEMCMNIWIAAWTSLWLNNKSDSCVNSWGATCHDRLPLPWFWNLLIRVSAYSWLHFLHLSFSYPLLAPQPPKLESFLCLPSLLIQYSFSLLKLVDGSYFGRPSWTLTLTCFCWFSFSSFSFLSICQVTDISFVPFFPVVWKAAWAEGGKPLIWIESLVPSRDLLT